MCGSPWSTLYLPILPEVPGTVRLLASAERTPSRSHTSGRAERSPLLQVGKRPPPSRTRLVRRKLRRTSVTTQRCLLRVHRASPRASIIAPRYRRNIRGPDPNTAAFSATASGIVSQKARSLPAKPTRLNCAAPRVQPGWNGPGSDLANFSSDPSICSGNALM